MAIRFDNTADYLQRATIVPSSLLFTMMGWFYRSAATGNISGLLRLAEDPGGSSYGALVNASGNLSVYSGIYTAGTALDLDTWYHVALVGDADNITAYLNGVLDIQTPQTFLDPTRIEVGNESESSRHLNGRAAAVKIYDAILSEDEILQEMAQHEPVRSENLNCWLPMVDDTAANCAKDYSGFGRHFTTAGTLTVEDGPPIPWRQGLVRLAFDLLAASPEFARPDGDVSAGSWTTTTLFSKVDEAAADDGDFITSATAPANDTCELSLSNIPDPGVSTGHILRVRRKKTAASSNQMDMRYRILQGTTEIASFTDDTNISDTAFALAERTLSGAQTDAITDYTNLRVEIRANQVNTNPPAPTFVAAGTGVSTATSGAGMSPGLPGGFAADDIHLMIAHNSGNVDFNTPSGWTLISSLTGNNTTAQRVNVWWRRAGGADTAPTLTMASSVTTVRGARIYGFRGCITSGDPWDSGAGAAPTRLNDTATNLVVNTTSITTTIANCTVVFLAAYEDDPNAGTTPSGYSTISRFGTTTGNDMSLWECHKSLSGTGTENPSTTLSGGTSPAGPHCGILIALKPPSNPNVAAQVSWVELEIPGIELTVDEDYPAAFRLRAQRTLLRM